MDIILNIFKNWGFSFWWPVDLEYNIKTNGDWRVEVLVGSILTQNTKWSLVEKNINLLKLINFEFSLENLIRIREDLIKVPFKKRKAETIRNVAKFILENFGSIKNMRKEDLFYLRNNLLKIKGIGKETADVILLYSIEKPIFVIDYYTKMLLNDFSEYDILRKKLEKYVKENFALFEKILIKKMKEIDCKDALAEYFNYRDSNKDTPLCICNYTEVDFHDKLVIIYKELHGMIDTYMKIKKFHSIYF